MYRLLLMPGLEGFRWHLSRARAWYMYEYARKRVPAYQAYTAQKNGPKHLLNEAGKIDLSLAPEMDKASYVKEFSIEARCLGGKIPVKGVTVDESSGSTGMPTNWVRGGEERHTTKHLLQMAFHGTLGKEPLFVINAFVMGAWATGMIVSQSLVDVCIMKSTGADAGKILRTIRAFGANYRYVIMAYPPFLKTLVDDHDLDWKQYRIDAVCGGEAISEPLRDYLLRYFQRVFSSYGASDLEINIAAESPLTIALRRELIANKSLRERVTKDYGSIPMIFQYNPLAYYIENNQQGELLVTLNRPTNVAPKIRYNIHDLGHVLRFKELKRILKAEGKLELLNAGNTRPLALPLLFHYGRSDMSVEFFGANVTPEGVRHAVQGADQLGPLVESFRLESREDERTDKHMKILIELRQGVINRFSNDTIAKDVYGRLADINGDFAKMLSFAPAHLQPTIEIFEHRQGPFTEGHSRIKHVYVASPITYDEQPR
jgi:phenylacetate-CoA ligase